MTRSLHLAKGRKRKSPFATVDEAIVAIRDGRMIIVVDDEDRENEGDLTMAASAVTPEAVNFMVTHGRGLVCLAMTPERLDHLDIPLEVSDNSSRRDTAMCVSIDAKAGTTTGVSAADRAQTIQTAIATDTKPRDRRPRPPSWCRPWRRSRRTSPCRDAKSCRTPRAGCRDGRAAPASSPDRRDRGHASP